MGTKIAKPRRHGRSRATDIQIKMMTTSKCCAQRKAARMVGGQRFAPSRQMNASSRVATRQQLSVNRSSVARVAALSSGASRMANGGASLRLSSSVSRNNKIVSRGMQLVVEAAKRSVGDLTEADLKGKKVFVRADLNVPLDGEQNITDDTRIRAAVPTLKYLLEKGAKVLLTSHLGRPKDGPEDKFRLNPVVPRLSELLGMDVGKADDCIGDEVTAKVNAMSDGEILVLENVRFYKEETKNESSFAEKLAANADMFVNDAFGTAHRAHASTEGVTKFLSPSVSGFLLAKELEYLDGAIADGEKPMCAIVGGSKVSSKITVLEALLDKCDKVIIGGGMVFTFLKAKGLPTGTSLCEDDYVETAKEVLAKAEKLGKEIILPLDVVVADAFSADANTKTVPVYEI